MAETEAELAVRFGAAIRAERKQRHWSQAVLAERLEVSLDYVGMLERGERLPSFPVAISIAALFETTISTMFAAPATSPPARATEPWLDEATVILRSLDPRVRDIVLGMLRAASAAPPASEPRAKGSGARRKR